MKTYNKFIKEILKDEDFELIKTSRKSTVKLIHKPSNSMYSIHPGDKAVDPVKSWIKRIKNK